jgi:cytochrome c oxidase subunit IV
MEHTTAVAAHSEHHDHVVGGGRKEIYRVTIILSVLTLIELALGYSMYYITSQLAIHIIKGFILILMLAKAFYIVGYFMHLRHELRNMIMSVVVPLLLFVWFIIAFLADGDSFNNLKNRYNFYYKEHMSQPMKHQKEEPHEEPNKNKGLD